MTEKRIKEIIRECINEITDNANDDRIKFNPNQFSSLTQRIKELYPNGTGGFHPYKPEERIRNFEGLFKADNPDYRNFKKWRERKINVEHWDSINANWENYWKELEQQKTYKKI